MTDTDTPAPPPPPPGHQLRRDRLHRMLGGVSMGLARYFEIDVVIVRVAFVVLAFFGGSGILLYLALWLLVPEADTDRTLAHELRAPRPPRRSLIVIVIATILGIMAVSDLFSSGPWWPHWHGGFGFFTAMLAIVVLVALLAGSHHGTRSHLRWFVTTTLLAALALFIVVAATVLTVETLSGVPLRGGLGSVQWQPTTSRAVARDYRLAVGNMVVDLRDVRFGPGTTDITATVGIGRVFVELPPGPQVSVTAHSGLGNVAVFGNSSGGFGTQRQLQSAGNGASGSHIVLDAEVGVGQVEVQR
ncbi:MAG: PspC domain-containing protein [Acidimicrobiales bacterium]